MQWFYNLLGSLMNICYGLLKNYGLAIILFTFITKVILFPLSVWVHNNSIQWLGGFDIDLPFWDANLNVQETGTYILKNSKIEDSIFKTLDVDYASTGYSNNKLVVNFTTSFLNGKLAPEVTALYGFEHKDLVVMPKVTIKPASSFKIIGSGLAMWTKDEKESEFGFWHKNSFVQLGAEVSF